jgi:hypothetical protein
MIAHGDEVRCHAGAGPSFSAASAHHRAAIQSPLAPKQIYLRVIPPTRNSEEAFLIDLGFDVR